MRRRRRGRAIGALSTTVPAGHLGLPRSVLRPGDIRVTTIDEIYRELCGRTHPPATLREWATVASLRTAVRRAGTQA